MKYIKSLGITIIGLMAFAVTLFGYVFWIQSWPMLCVPVALWLVFFMLLVHALKPSQD